MPKELPIELPITPHSAREEPSDLGEADPAEPPPSTARSVAPTAERPAPLAPADLVALLAELTAEGHAYGTNVGAQLAQGRRLTHGQREALKRIQAQREREAPGVAKAAARSPPRGRSTAQRCPEGEAGEFKGKVY